MIFLNNYLAGEVEAPHHQFAQILFDITNKVRRKNELVLKICNKSLISPINEKMNPVATRARTLVGIAVSEIAILPLKIESKKLIKKD